MTESEQKSVIDTLTSKTLRVRCPICHKKDWTLYKDYVLLGVSVDPLGYSRGRRRLPCVTVYCGHCGYVRLLALGSLGLLDVPLRIQKEREEREQARREAAIETKRPVKRALLDRVKGFVGLGGKC